MMQIRVTTLAALRTLVLAAPLMVAAADHPFTDDDWAGSSPASIPMATSNHDRGHDSIEDFRLRHRMPRRHEPDLRLVKT